MKKHLTTSALLVLLFAAAALLPGCATDGAATGPSDRDIVADIQDRLRNDALTSRYLYSVAADQGIVSIDSGDSDPIARARALDIARGAEGVKGVIDDSIR
jgi:osmotically-inducible protein OsmY